MFILDMAVRLIASGGAYANKSVSDVTGEILADAEALDDYFEIQAFGPESGESIN